MTEANPWRCAECGTWHVVPSLAPPMRATMPGQPDRNAVPHPRQCARFGASRPNASFPFTVRFAVNAAAPHFGHRTVPVSLSTSTRFIADKSTQHRLVIHENRATMPGRSTTQRDRDRATIRRSRPACGICGEPIDYTLPHLDPGAYVVDHITPLHLGGPDTLDNKQAAHRACNRTKGVRTDGAGIIRRSGSLNRPWG